MDLSTHTPLAETAGQFTSGESKPPAVPPRTAEARDVLARYASEREKRLRSDPAVQYETLEPLAASRVALSADATGLRTDHVCVAIIGGGFAGLIAGARLHEAGIDSIRVVEKGSDFGGTWFWNRYPGAQSDTASMVYLPLLEETGHIPTEKYVHAPEVFEHCQRIARHYRLYDDVHFRSTVTSAHWDEDRLHWRLKTSRGKSFTAQFLVFGIGQFHVPRRPAIPGWRRFRGHIFHTALWDYAYTGGDASGAPMTRLADKRVGIIGTGATAVQCVPHLSETSKRFFVFQRTPSAVDLRDNGPIDEHWFQSVAKPGWQKRWLENFVASRDPTSLEPDLVNDGWTAIAQRVREKLEHIPQDLWSADMVLRIQEQADLENMNRIRDRVDRIVRDANTADQLKSWYFQFCKRPCFHDDYLASFNNPNTTLVDTNGKGIDRITENGVIAAGREYGLDCIILASGFNADPIHLFNTELRVVGRNGRSLADCWSQGMQSYHGIHVHGFPNAFNLQPVQGANLLSNIPHNLIDSAETIAAVVRHARSSGARVVEAEEAAQRDWVALLLTGRRRLASDACTPGNYNNEGRPDDPVFRLNVGYPDGPAAFFRYIDAWRSDRRFTGLAFR